MILSTITQVKLLVANILAGILTGVLFDIYRIIRGYNNNKIITFIEDILFWILSAIIVFIFLFLTGYAYFGFYCYIYIVIGIIFYLKLASKYSLKIMRKLIGIVCKSIRVFINFISYIVGNILYLLIKDKKKYKNNLNKK